MFKILSILTVTFILVIIILLLFISFMNKDIDTKIEKYTSVENYNITGGPTNAVRISRDGNRYLYFGNSGTFILKNDMICDILIVGGGGGAGSRHGGGGGGGQVKMHYSKLLKGGSYTINIGNGGASAGTIAGGGVDGSPSTISYINSIIYTAVGGKRGGRPDEARIGGTSGNGFSGAGGTGGGGENFWGGGGGGGANENGYGSVLDGNSLAIAGNGGNGLMNNITGEQIYYGGGGGGGCSWNANRPGNGGLGGGGNGSKGPTTASNGQANTGGGGGGSGFSGGTNGYAGNGGSGVVIIKFLNLDKIYTDIWNFFNNKIPYGMYLAENWTSNEINESMFSSNNKKAITSGNIKQIVESGNGASGKIISIVGGIGEKINFTNIPENFTVLSLTRYNGGSRGRILTTKNGTNWLHGHHHHCRGVCHYEFWNTPGDQSIGNLNDWLCCIGDNFSDKPNNILVDGETIGTTRGGNAGLNHILTINDGTYHQPSDWAFGCVIIWDKQLSMDEKLLLNTMISLYLINGGSLENMINYNYISGKVSVGERMGDRKLTEDSLCLIRNSYYEYIPIIPSNKISSSPNNTNTFSINKYNSDGFYIITNKNIDIKNSGEFIEYTFSSSFILKKYSFKATSELKNSPSSWKLYIHDGTNYIVIDEKSANENDYSATNCKSENYCLNFLIYNYLPSNKYLFVFNNIFRGGSKLDIEQIEFFSGNL